MADNGVVDKSKDITIYPEQTWNSAALILKEDGSLTIKIDLGVHFDNLTSISVETDEQPETVTVRVVDGLGYDQEIVSRKFNLSIHCNMTMLNHLQK